jgi:hypothetical protein
LALSAQVAYGQQLQPHAGTISAEGRQEGDLAGPPAPGLTALVRPERAGTRQQVADARGAWRWYAVAWSIDAGSSALALSRPGTLEGSVLLGDRPVLVHALKAGLAVGSWRLGVHWARGGHPERASALRWVYAIASAFAGVWNVSVAW